MNIMKLCPEFISDADFVKMCKDHFLGDTWYIVDPLGHEQINAIALKEIFERYPYKKKRRKFWF